MVIGCLLVMFLGSKFQFTMRNATSCYCFLVKLKLIRSVKNYQILSNLDY